MGRIASVRLASRNEHKLRELRELLPDWKLEPLEADDFPEERGRTFYENARAKACFGLRLQESPDPVLGEDSGLEVDALAGRPGLYSARFAGEDATDEKNVARLLEELAGVEEGARGARYVSELVWVSHHRREVRGTGVLRGRISREARGSGGFGYDPVFVPEGEEHTVAELGSEWKGEHSHRAKAAAALAAALRQAGVGL